MNDPNVLFSKAYTAQVEGRHHKSEKLYKKLLKMSPEIDVKATILYNLGLLMMSMNRYADACEYFDQSNKLSYNDENTWNKCLSLLNLGKWENGMQIFSSRYGKTRNNSTAVSFPDLPLTLIEHAHDAVGSNVLVLNEQGLGDEILFSTQLEKLSRIAREVTVQVSKETYSLFKKIYKFDNVKFEIFDTIDVEDLYEYDVYISFGNVFSSLYEYGTSVTSNSYYQNPFNDKVGVCWMTNRKSPNSDKRSIDPSNLLFLGFEKVSLQYGEGCGDELGLEDFLPEDCLETWNKLDELDAVVTVDTLVAHLAGLKGIPTLLVINEHLDWRWKYRDPNDERYSMFYPMVEIVSIKDNFNSILKEIIG